MNCMSKIGWLFCIYKPFTSVWQLTLGLVVDDFTLILMLDIYLRVNGAFIQYKTW